MSDDEARLIDLEHDVSRHDEAVIEDAKDISELKSNVATLAKEAERLNTAVLKIAEALATVPNWADKRDVEQQIRPQLKNFMEFQKLISELKKFLSR